MPTKSKSSPATGQKPGSAQFHIHVDAVEMDSKFEATLKTDFGFYRVEYSIDEHSVDLGDECPPHECHWTLKTSDTRHFKAIVKKLFAILETAKPIRRGYVECEHIAFAQKFDLPRYKEAAIPFRLKMRAPRPGAFRESEIHVTLSRDESDPRLIDALQNRIGMLSGFIPKEWGVAQIFTAQGTRAQINQIRDPLYQFLLRAGGAVRCSMKEERTVHYWMSHKAGIGLPHVIAEINRAG
jgi:hypothetical protein